MIGTELSHYKILEKIGEGGMGVVYRAQDTNLSREVAIKVLPEQFTKDPQRLARFEREAKLLASLNHPNIAAIYGLEEADGVRLLSLELVEGETLAERVAKGPVPVEETLEICRQIGEGVEAAHEKGVIHRDLKPANVKVTPEGKVKILDFGLAKAFEGEFPVTDISQSPTLTEEMTRAGVILGTAAYMSPEQARGKPVDKRADIFAFGVVLYELLSSKRAFGGETVTDTLAKVLEGEPDWDALPRDLPSTIRFLMSRCLQKDAGKRLQHIDGARILIEEALTGATAASAIGLGGPIQPALWKRAIPWGLAVIAVLAAGLASWNLSGPIPQLAGSGPLKKFVIAPPEAVPLGSFNSRDLAITRDGKRVVYRSTRGPLYLRSIDEFEVRPISGTEGLGGNFFLSPNGESLAFFAQNQLKRVSLVGGGAVTLWDAPISTGRSENWGLDGTIVFSAGGSLYRLPDSGGEPESLATRDLPESGLRYINPKILPGGQAILYTIRHGFANFRVAVLALETREETILLENARDAHYVPTGHLVYEQETGTLMAVLFDLAGLEIIGGPVPVLEGIRRYLADASSVDYSLSDEGTLVYVPSGISAPHGHRLVWVDRQGREDLVTEEGKDIRSPRISPDGKRVVFSIFEEDPERNVWLYDLEGESFSRFTFEGELSATSLWSPDGEWIVYQAGSREERYLARQRADRSSPPEQLTSATTAAQIPNSFTPDGRVLAFNFAGDIALLAMDGDGKSEPLVASPNRECCSKFSPDGKWMAYVSNETGDIQVYVTPYPKADVKWLISEEGEGGGQPVWSPDGSELFYRSGDTMMVVSVQTEPTFSASRPRVLFEGSYVSHSNPPGLQYYDISPDGERFLMLQEVTGQAQNQIYVIQNWFEELKRRVPTH